MRLFDGRTTTDLFGLSGFTVSGILFVLSAIRSGDLFSLAGSIVWILSCLGWMAALTRKERR